MSNSLSSGRRWGWVLHAIVMILTTILMSGEMGQVEGLLEIPLTDAAPTLISMVPAPNEDDVHLSTAQDGTLSVTFSEPVSLGAGALELACERSGLHGLTASDGPETFTFISDRLFLPGESCVASVIPEWVTDLDSEDPPDQPASLYTWSFRTVAQPIVINELDAVTPEGRGEFVELYDGGRGDIDLTGLTIVFYRSDQLWVYLAIGLDGYRTNEAGYFVIGDSGIAEVDILMADGTLLDGPDAVALYNAPETEFPRRSPISPLEPIDATVYGSGAPQELMSLLLPEQEPLDENKRETAGTDSSQRCPNGAGLPRTTGSFVTDVPTPGSSNRCIVDEAPELLQVKPAPDGEQVLLDAPIELWFNEPVELAADAVEIACTSSGLHTYAFNGENTTYQITPIEPFVEKETCTITVFAERIDDLDKYDPPANMGSNVTWSFHTYFPVAETVVINEVDADTPDVDTAEFIELFDGGEGFTSLDGSSIVLFNGETDSSYKTIELDGYQTNETGYFLIGNDNITGAQIKISNGLMQNGPDAVALVAGGSIDYPDGTPITATVPLDAFVYSHPGANDPGLQLLLNDGQPQIDENGRGNADLHSNQRCPNGEGGRRNSIGYKQNIPTPGYVNDCITDIAPSIHNITPNPDATGIDIHSSLVVEFDEPVKVAKDWISLSCTASGVHDLKTNGGASTYTVEASSPLLYSEICTVSIHASLVTDMDEDDPPDSLVDDKVWSFTTAQKPADFIVINEIDTNTPGVDTAEFIELYDGGLGRTSLDGLLLVLFNGANNQSYRTIDLDGFETDDDGYLVIGNSSVNPALETPDGVLQNGPDAVALYIANPSQFPTGSPVIIQGLVDAVSYGKSGELSSELLSLLVTGQNPVDENARDSTELHSVQRCPNGSGGPRRTASFIANSPTPGKPSNCITDNPPKIIATNPVDKSESVSIYTKLSITFDEPVHLDNGAVELTCTTGGQRAVILSGGPVSFDVQLNQPLDYKASCKVRVISNKVSDLDTYDPPDRLDSNFEWSFTTIAKPPDFILINEIDADTPGNDEAEFIELYDGGKGNTDLSGLILVFFNGNDDKSYYVVDLTGSRTNGAGYLAVGNEKVPGVSIITANGVLQNGADAVALYASHPDDFSHGSPVRVVGLVDALVYGTSDPNDNGLLELLDNGQLQVDEAKRGTAVNDSIGRCPNGSGAPRQTSAYRPTTPTPGQPNNCQLDEAPTIIQVYPPDAATGVESTAALTVNFSEDVVLDSNWYVIDCDVSGSHTAAVSGGPQEFKIQSTEPFEADEQCEVTLIASKIADKDKDDPPDSPAANFQWRFRTQQAAPIADFIVINEADTDTPGSDSAEFVELFDGGIGNTNLSGLVVVFWNGSTDKVYQVIDLANHRTDRNGYFVLGNSSVEPDLSFANGTLQNGPDAISLHAGRVADISVGSGLTTESLIDAIVYGPASEIDRQLLVLLNSGESQLDEASRGNEQQHSLQRCPNGTGGQRQTASFRPGSPTPGDTSHCDYDQPPEIIIHYPPDGGVDVAIDSPIIVGFSEDVEVDDGWFTIECDSSGLHPATVAGGPIEFTLTPIEPYQHNENCLITLFPNLIRDRDADDPPDHPLAGSARPFRTAPPLPPPSASFTSNGPVWIGETVVFTNLSQGAGPLAFSWDFGDGGPPTGDHHPAHRYQATGTYTVTLTVTGPTGTATSRRAIAVRPRRLYWPVVGGR